MKLANLLILALIAFSASASLRKKVRKLNVDAEQSDETPLEEALPEFANSTGETAPINCKHSLLYSYGILTAGLTNHTSTLCGDAKVATCCSKTSEEVIMNYWKNNNKLKIKHYIEGYVWLFKAILNHYQLYKTKAQQILEYPGSPKICKSNAESFINSYVDKSEIEKFVVQLIKTFENLAFTRKAFYCALCNADYQEFFDLKSKSVKFSRKFCEQLVETSLVQVWTRNEIYMSIFNSMSVIAECDPNSEYHPENYVVDMRLRNSDQNRVEKCYESFVTKNQKDPRVYFDDCSDFCSGYSLTSATEMFEGNFGKLYYLFRKLRQFNEALNIKQMIFEQVDVTEQYDFSMISPEFFEANLKNVRFEKFDFVWDRTGLELFYIASKSHTNFGYGSAATIRALGLALTICISLFWSA